MNFSTIVEEYNDNEIARDFLRLAEYTNESIFLAGKAGTGKSYLLTRFIEYTTKKFVLLAPTGVAAINIGGQTIHSFFQMPIDPLLPNDPNIRTRLAKREILENLEVIIIDEISMVRCDVMNAVDLSLRKNLGNNLPFGGKQMILVGDMFQLPPVVDSDQVQDILKNNYSSIYFYGSKIFDDGFDFSYIELKRVYRQTENHFISLLDKVRTNIIDTKDLELLNSRSTLRKSEPNDSSIILSTTNRDADEINTYQLNKLDGFSSQFMANLTGSFNRRGKRKPTVDVLNLKIGAKVMLIINDIQKRWVNGDIGIVERISEGAVSVRIGRSGEEHIINRHIWEEYKYEWNQNKNQIEKEVVGTFEQLPIKLAWAITVHKSQGQTFDNVIIDIGNRAFATGQVYVALTKCRTFTGMSLVNYLTAEDIKVDNGIIIFLSALKENNMNREKIEMIFKGLEKKLRRLEDENLNQKQIINTLKSENAQIYNELKVIKKQNNKRGIIIKLLTLSIIAVIILLLYNFTNS